MPPQARYTTWNGSHMSGSPRSAALGLLPLGQVNRQQSPETGPFRPVFTPVTAAKPRDHSGHLLNSMRLRGRMPHVRPFPRGQASGSPLLSLLKSLLLAAQRAATPAHLPNSIGNNAEEAAERPQWQLSYHMLHADAACRLQATSLISRVEADRRMPHARSVTCGHVRDMPSYI